MSTSVSLEQPQSPGTPAVLPEAAGAQVPQPPIRATLVERIEKYKRFANGFLDDVVKPAIKAFLETCDSNPRVAAIVATPALLAFALVAGFFILSASTLVLWSIFTISIAVVFVVMGGLLSLFFKLAIVLLATIPLAGMATGLLVAANGASKFIISKLPNNGLPSTVELPQSLRDVDWTAIVQGANAVATYAAQGAREAGPVLLSMRDIAVTLGKALYSAFETAASGMNSQSATERRHGDPDDSTRGEGEVQETAPVATGVTNPETNLTRRTTYQSGEEEHDRVE